MLIVRIPNRYKSTLANLRQLIYLSQHLGFDMTDLRVEESANDQVEFHKFDTVVKVSTDLDDCENISGDYKLFYRESAHKHNFKFKPIAGDIYLDIDDHLGLVDVWFNSMGDKFSSRSVSKIDSVDWHLSWFILAMILEFPIEDALMLARAGCVSRETWPNDVMLFPQPMIDNYVFNSSSSHLNQQINYPTITDDLGLYPVVDSADWIEKLLERGIKTVQLRIKHPESVNLEHEIKRSVELGKKYHAKVFINDYWQLAIKHGAYGIHLGQEDIVKADLNAIAKYKIRLGISTHGYYEILRITQFNPSYIALGHIFPTTTKQMPSQPQGLVRLALYQQLINSIGNDNTRTPTVAIGGIDRQTAPAVWRCGVDSLAVVRAVTEADDISEAIQGFVKLMEETRC